MFDSETRIPSWRSRGQGTCQILKINMYTHPRAPEPTRSVHMVRQRDFPLQNMTRGAAVLATVIFKHAVIFSHMWIRCMLKRVCVTLHVKVFFLSACSGQLIPFPLGKGCMGNRPLGEDPSWRDKRKKPKVIPTPVIIYLHISSLLALPGCLKYPDRDERHSFYGASK